VGARLETTRMRIKPLFISGAQFDHRALPGIARQISGIGPQLDHRALMIECTCQRDRGSSITGRLIGRSCR
jgi:hypothetical protein